MMRRVSQLKKHIVNSYGIPEKKFDIVKIGSGVWLYIVTKENELDRVQIFSGSLETVETNMVLRKYLEKNIEEALIKFRYLTRKSQNF